MENIIEENELNYFLYEIERTFPNFVAGIITDRHGFLLASKIPQNFHIHENQLALSAIAGNRDFIEDSRFLKVKRDLDKSKNIKLFLLLEKSTNYINRFKSLKGIIDMQNLF